MFLKLLPGLLKIMSHFQFYMDIDVFNNSVRFTLYYEVLQSDLYRTDTFLSLIVSKRIVLATTYYTENVVEFWEIIYLYSNC